MAFRKPLDLPPVMATAFVKDIHAYLAEEDGHKRDAIAERCRDYKVLAKGGCTCSPH